MSAPLLTNFVIWSLQMAGVAAAALAVDRLLRLPRPSLRYVLLRAVLAVCLLLPVVQPRLAGPAGDVGTSIVSAAVAGQPPPAPSPARRLAGALDGGIVLALLAAGALLRLAWMACGIARLRRLRFAGGVFEGDDLHIELQRAIETRATIRYVAGLGQPVTFGVRHPIVLLPLFSRDHPAAMRRAVLAHELWHVRRRDWLWTVAEETLRALFWFNPALWLLLSRIQSCREEVVDQAAIEVTGSRRAYIDALLAYADEAPLFAATAFARRRHLVHRLMLISQEAVMSARRVTVSCAVLAVAVMSAGWSVVHALPMVGGQNTVMSPQPGPVELRARPVPSDKPAPRQTRHVAPDYPAAAAAAAARGTVTMRLAVDEKGHAAEVRLVGADLSMYGGTISFKGASSGPGAADAEINHQPVRPVLEAVAQAAGRAVLQWQYAPPADGPVVFDVDIPIGPSLPSRSAVPTTRATPGPLPEAAPASQDTAGPDITNGALRVGGAIKAPAKVRNVPPVYPAEAMAAGVQGVVIVQTRVEPDGTVGQTRVLRSIPMLDAAAVEAVRQWQFTPTLMNGVAVPIVMVVTVNFTLQ